jgi:hypothetical protein
MTSLARRLSLGLPPAPWFAQRVRVAALAQDAALVAGSTRVPFACGASLPDKTSRVASPPASQDFELAVADGISNSAYKLLAAAKRGRRHVRLCQKRT